MAKQTINLGTSVNKGDGDPLRTAFTKINQNFDELYNTLGTDGSIFNPLSVDSHIIPDIDNTRDLGSPTKQWRDIFVSTGSVYIGDIKLSNDAGTLKVQQVTDVGLVTETPVPDAPGAVTTDRLVNGANTFVLKDNGTVELNGDPFTGGGAGPVQPYVELTNSPFIVQPVVLGSPVSVSTPGDGSGAQVEVVIGEGPAITSITVTTPGTGYIVGQRYKVWSYQIGGSNSNTDSVYY